MALPYSATDLQALWLSLRLATATSLLLVIACMPLSFWLAGQRGKLAALIEALVALPLVLPPTVLGFYLLTLLGPHGVVGRLAVAVGIGQLTFSPSGILIGALIGSLPFVVQAQKVAFAAIEPALLEAASTLRAGPLDRFVHVVLPLAYRGSLAGATLAFAHTLGEFGVVLMIGGSIPGRTQTASVAIFSHVEASDYRAAHWLSATLVAICFTLMSTVYLVNRKRSADPHA